MQNAPAVPGQQICIRARVPADLPGCVAALASVHTSGGYPTNWPADPARWLSPSGTVRGWVASIQDSIAGHVILRQPPLRTASHGSVELSRLFVSPDTRRNGIASALVKAAMLWAAASDLDVELEVTDHLLAARALYERSGFRLVDIRQADWTAPDGSPVAVCHYAWSPRGS